MVGCEQPAPAIDPVAVPVTLGSEESPKHVLNVAGAWILGTPSQQLATTVIENEHVDELPQLSRAVYTTLYTPGLNVVPGVKLLVKDCKPQLSLATGAVQFTTA